MPFKSRSRNASLIGEQDGWRQGWSDGYLLGQSEAIQQQYRSHIVTWPLRMIYVTTGIGDPYPALDQAIIDSLQDMVEQLVVVSPADDVTRIAADVQPDLCLVLNGVVMPAEQVNGLRSQGIRTAIWFTDDPYYTDWTRTIALRYDYVFTLEINCVDFYKSLGCKHVYYLPFAVNPRYFHPSRVNHMKRTEICFVGVAYAYRLQFIDRLASYLSERNTLISGLWWDQLQQYQKLKSKIQLGVWMNPELTAATYSASKITINLHRRHDDRIYNRNSDNITAASVNPRTFEIAACGTLQLCDERDELKHFYVPDSEIVTYSSTDELIEKANYYLQHEQKRQEIVLRGLQRTLIEHTYYERLNQLLATIFPKG